MLLLICDLMSIRLNQLDYSHFSYVVFSTNELVSVGTDGSSTCNAKSKSVHPNVKRILSFQSEKLSPFKNGI
jgi:hypothetical protein